MKKRVKRHQAVDQTGQLKGQIHIEICRFFCIIKVTMCGMRSR